MSTAKYPEYQNLGIVWNLKAPAHWKPSRLKFDSYIKARVGWHGLKSDDFTDQGPYLVTGSDFQGKVIDWSNCYHCDIQRYDQDPYIQLQDDDLLITKDGTIGKVILAGKLPGKATLNSGVFVLRPLNNSYQTKFYYWLMQSSVFHGFVEYFKTGSTIAHLYQETFSNIPYALPPLHEQRTIAAFLDHETARIDRLIAKQQRLIELLKEKRQAVISHAVTKGLDPDAPMKDSGVEWLGEVPAHWNAIRVKQIATFITSGPRGWSDFLSDNGDDVFLQSGDLNDDLGLKLDTAKRVSPPQGTEGTRTKLQNGDVVVCITGANTGRVAVVAGLQQSTYVNQHLSLIRPNSERINANYLAMCLSASPGRSYFDVSQYGLKEGLSLSNVCETPLALPPRHEQDLIVYHINKLKDKFNELSYRATQQINLLQERRTALISAAVTGKIDVRDWKPAQDTVENDLPMVAESHPDYQTRQEPT